MSNNNNPKYRIEKITGKNPVYHIIDEETEAICYILRKEDALLKAQKKTKNKIQKITRLLVFPALIMRLISGDWDFDYVNNAREAELSLFRPDNDTPILKYKRFWKGAKMYLKNKEVGKMAFKKRELVCKYDIEYQGIFIGKVIPDGISHLNLKVEKEGEIVAVFSRKSGWENSNVGRFQVLENTSKDNFFALLTAVFLWV